jgi:hypothetical protein
MLDYVYGPNTINFFLIYQNLLHWSSQVEENSLLSFDHLLDKKANVEH